MKNYSILLLALLACIESNAFTVSTKPTLSRTMLQNTYDDWRSDAIVDQMPLDEEAVQMCLDELISSDFGAQMFGVHDAPGE